MRPFFSFRLRDTPGAQTGPVGVQQTPLWGQTGPNTTESGPKRYPIAFYAATMAAGLDTAPQGGPGSRFWRFWAILAGGFRPGPRQAHLGSNGHRFGVKRVETQLKADPNVTQLYSVHQQRQLDLARRPMETPGPIFGVLGPFLGPEFLQVPGAQNRPKYH